MYGALAALVVVIHLAFVLYAVLGGLLVLRWRWTAWIHVPASLWAVLIELTGGVCPLTPLENHLRAKAGAAGYQSGFVEHYLIPALYPAHLTWHVQILLGLLLLEGIEQRFFFAGGMEPTLDPNTVQ